MATTYMNLTLPIESVTPPTTWGTYLNAALTFIDSHDHSSGSGKQVTSLGLDIDSDLDIQSNNLDSIRSLRLDAQSVAINGANDVRCLYAVGTNLYYNNSSGVQIQLTSGSAINSSAIATNVFELTSISSHTTISAIDSFVFLKVSTTAARNITLPAAGAVTAGRYYVIKDITGTSSAYNISLIPNGTDTIEGVNSTKLLKYAFGSWIVISDGASNWSIIYSATHDITNNTYGVSSLATTINGSSVTVAGAMAVNVASTLAATLTTSGVGQLRSGVDGSIVLAASANDWPTFDTARTRSIQFAPTRGSSFTNWSESKPFSYWQSTGGGGGILSVDIPAHHGATLDSITLYYVISGSRFPANKLGIRVKRFDPLAATREDLIAATTAYVDGVDAGTYYQGGIQLSCDLAMDQNNVIDSETYRYVVYVDDETGIGSSDGNFLYGLKANYSNITNLTWG